MKFIVAILFLVATFRSYSQTPEKAAADREYVANQVEWIKRYLDAEIRSVREAVDKVEKTNTAKFESVNEFRLQLKDQASTFVTRRELYSAVVALGTLIIAAAGVVVNYLKKAKKEA